MLARLGAAGLDFELRAYVADVFLSSMVASDIRFSLLTPVPRKRHYHSPAHYANADPAEVGLAWTPSRTNPRRRAASTT